MSANLKIFTNNVEEEAVNQINFLLEQEAFKDCKVRIMPDVHAGKGCVIGFTGDLGDKVIPNIVGVDIGCGMLTTELGQIDINLEELDNYIREKIPSGFNVHEERKILFPQLEKLNCYRELRDTKRIERSLGTLGGGNHFIEVDIDNDGNKYLIIHTGSRNLGKQVADFYQELANQLCNYNNAEYQEKAQEIIEQYKKLGKKKEIQKVLLKLKQEYLVSKNVIPKDLAYLDGKYREDYLKDMGICQEFASLNRLEIAKNICENFLNIKMDDLKHFQTIHNYIDLKSNIVRKGAISAQKNEVVLIPINMKDGCIIARGKGNIDWNESAPHGAGRIMSRIKAKETFKLEDFQKSMAGIYTTSVNKDTIDEAPFVYKPIQEIIDNIKDTIDIIKIIKPIYNFKASE